MKRILSLLALSIPLLWGCDSESTSLSGTNDETTTSLGVIYRPDGEPAVGARVLLYASGDTQATPRAVGIVDNDGHVTLAGTPTPGLYNLLIRSTRSNEAIFQDSLVSDGKRLTVFDDTLRRTGKLVGRVRVQPQDKPAIAWVQLIGAGRYVNLDDSGRFVIDSLPAGRFTLAAQTREPKYTTTFRYPIIRSDSLTDLGSIDLIYTGVPMVRNVKASWDSVAATVTVRWDSVPERGLLGYRVVRGTYSDPGAMNEMAYVTDGRHWTDTLFRGLKYGGSLGGQYDSMQTDLFYRVIAVTNNGESPISFADSLNVRSPVLTHAWNLPWSVGSVMPAGYTYGSLDSLGDGVAMLATKDSFQTLWTSQDGKSWSQGLTLPANVGGVFWKGKLWWTTLRGSGQSYVLHDSYRSDSIMPMADTVYVHSFDGASTRSVSVKTFGDTVTACYLVPMQTGLALEETRRLKSPVTSIEADLPGDVQVSVDGTVWEVSSGRGAAWWKTVSDWNFVRFDLHSYALYMGSGTSMFVQHGSLDTAVIWESEDMKAPMSVPVRTGDAPRSWTIPAVNRIILVDSLMVLEHSSRLWWASRAAPDAWHVVEAPSRSPGGMLVWRNQLLVSDGVTLWSAPLPSGT